MKTYVIDIDGTLIKSERVDCGICFRAQYRIVKVNKKEIEAVNRHYAAGDTIILWTGRGWDLYKTTVDQLRRIGIRYHELYMGKPIGIYVDADALRSLT